MIFNDAARFLTVGGTGWNNPELNLPVAWGITDSNQSGGGFMDGDGDLDLLVHFKTAETGIACGDTDATLAGQTFGGLMIMGTDSSKTEGWYRMHWCHPA